MDPLLKPTFTTVARTGPPQKNSDSLTDCWDTGCIGMAPCPPPKQLRIPSNETTLWVHAHHAERMLRGGRVWLIWGERGNREPSRFPHCVCNRNEDTLAIALWTKIRKPLGDGGEHWLLMGCWLFHLVARWLVSKQKMPLQVWMNASKSS